MDFNTAFTCIGLPLILGIFTLVVTINEQYKKRRREAGYEEPAEPEEELTDQEQSVAYFQRIASWVSAITLFILPILLKQVFQLAQLIEASWVVGIIALVLISLSGIRYRILEYRPRRSKRYRYHRESMALAMSILQLLSTLIILVPMLFGEQSPIRMFLLGL